MGELTDAFSLDRVTKSPAVFDMKKLRWVNGQHLRALLPDEFAALAPQLHELGVTTAADVTPFVHAARRWSPRRSSSSTTPRRSSPPRWPTRSNRR